MKKLILITILIIGTSISSFAQSKWYIAPATSAAVSKNNSGITANITIGRYLGQSEDIRLDLFASYLFSSKLKDYQTIALMATAEGTVNIFNTDKIYSSASIGLGLMTNSIALRNDNPDSNFNDIVLPIKATAGYRINKTLSVGVELSYQLNLSNIKERSLIYTGIFLGIRF